MYLAGTREAGLHAVRYHDNAQVIEEIEKLLTPSEHYHPMAGWTAFDQVVEPLIAEIT